MITILSTANAHINNLYYYFPLKVTCGIRYKQTQLCLRREFLTKHTMNPWGLTNMCEALFISCSLPKQYFFTRRLSSRIANFNVDWWKRENVECMSYCLRTGMRATEQVPNHQTLLHRRPKSLDLTNMTNVLLFLLHTGLHQVAVFYTCLLFPDTLAQPAVNTWRSLKLYHITPLTLDTIS